MSCSLCEILTMESDRIVYKDECVFIALNFEPLKPGHLMILPVLHVENLSDLDPDSARAFLAGIDTAMRVLSVYSQETPICIVNGWSNRTQPHLHAHVLPGKYDLRGLFSRAESIPGRQRADNENLAATCRKLQNILNS